jgi:hypothetical protein
VSEVSIRLIRHPRRFQGAGHGAFSGVRLKIHFTADMTIRAENDSEPHVASAQDPVPHAIASADPDYLIAAEVNTTFKHFVRAHGLAGRPGRLTLQNADAELTSLVEVRLRLAL